MGLSKVQGKMVKGNDAIVVALDELEGEGWAVAHLVQHSKDQGSTKFIFRK